MTAPKKVTDIQILHVFVSDNKAFELDLSQLFTSDQLGEDPALRWLAEKTRLFTRNMAAFTKRQGIVFEVIGSDPSIEGSAEDIFGAVYRNSFLARAAPRGVTALEGLPANYGLNLAVKNGAKNGLRKIRVSAKHKWMVRPWHAIGRVCG